MLCIGVVLIITQDRHDLPPNLLEDREEIVKIEVEEPYLGRGAFDEDEDLLETEEFDSASSYRSNDHDPEVVEANALKAVARTKQAAMALQSTRSAVMRLEQLGDTVGVAAALKAEQAAKGAFISARETSAPLVSEARANYEANQGSEIQSVARQVAQDTWRSMTGIPLANTPLDAAVGTPIADADSRAAVVRQASMTIAGKYVRQARQARAKAIEAQRHIDGLNTGAQQPSYPQDALAPIRGNPAVSVVAGYAQKAQAAMRSAQAAEKAIEVQKKYLKDKQEAIKQAKAKTKSAAESKPADEAGEVIANAEQDVASSMRAVQAAAMKRGMTDNTWKSRIGGMLKNGQAAEADQAAKEYVQQHIEHAASKVIGSSAIHAAANEVANAQAGITKIAENRAAAKTVKRV